jgi:hypothetical protein
MGVILSKNFLRFFTRKKFNSRKIKQILELAQPCRLGDGSTLIGFSRFNRHPEGIWASPTRNTLHYALSQDVLDNLIRQNGYLILYTHLGLPMNCKGELFSEEDKSALIRLAEEYHNGNIWVARTVDILTYLNVIRHLEYDVRKEGERTIINILSIHDPIDGRRLPEESELSWLCFYTPRPEKTFIRLNGSDLKIQINQPENSNEKSISLSGMPFPDLDSIDG